MARRTVLPSADRRSTKCTTPHHAGVPTHPPTTLGNAARNPACTVGALQLQLQCPGHGGFHLRSGRPRSIALEKVWSARVCGGDRRLRAIVRVGRACAGGTETGASRHRLVGRVKNTSGWSCAWQSLPIRTSQPAPHPSDESQVPVPAPILATSACSDPGRPPPLPDHILRPPFWGPPRSPDPTREHDFGVSESKIFDAPPPPHSPLEPRTTTRTTFCLPCD